MEEDILNYSPTLMFRGTPCVAFDIFLNYFVMEFYFRNLMFVARNSSNKNRKTFISVKNINSYFSKIWLFCKNKLWKRNWIFFVCIIFLLLMVNLRRIVTCRNIKHFWILKIFKGKFPWKLYLLNYFLIKINIFSVLIPIFTTL